MAGIHIIDIEAAINFWRAKSPSPDGITLTPELRALAEVYALLVYYREDQADEASMPPQAAAAWRTWYETTPDTPCIAICSTSQGDELCKGCGRTFDEVQHWPSMTPGEKRQTWRRITLQSSAWRFNKYAERAAEGVPCEPSSQA
ncbi:MAG: Fe-S protein [Burkholderiales bacterium PBB4]|nr:MAG: Fe-S protein [Burkholderiales bacterium PBB4]